jgi:hypothetical protein
VCRAPIVREKQELTDDEEVRKLMGFIGASALDLRGLPMLAVHEGHVLHQIDRSVRC